MKEKRKSPTETLYSEYLFVPPPIKDLKRTEQRSPQDTERKNPRKGMYKKKSEPSSFKKITKGGCFKMYQLSPSNNKSITSNVKIPSLRNLGGIRKL